MPHPAEGVLYVKLRDDPATVQTLTLPVMPSTGPSARAESATSRPPTAARGGAENAMRRRRPRRSRSLATDAARAASGDSDPAEEQAGQGPTMAGFSAPSYLK